MSHKIRSLKSKMLLIALSISSIMLLMTMSSCIIGVRETPPPGSPQIKITSPTSNALAGDVKVSVDISNFKLVPGSSKQGEGQVIFYMDVPVPTYYDHPAITTGGTYVPSTETSYTWKNVPPGQHTFSAQLVNEDNRPMPAPAVASVTINVGAPRGNPGLTISPSDGSELPPGMVIITAQVNNFIISQKDMGPVNREGEGHLIYYTDEDPPADQGQPAVTDTSITSTVLTQRWKSISEGKHTFAVQLVNNDDSPLNPPVMAKITLDIKPAP